MPGLGPGQLRLSSCPQQVRQVTVAIAFGARSSPAVVVLAVAVVAILLSLVKVFVLKSWT